MGAADVIPGVSGGTIAFITGIYEEFVHALQSIGSSFNLLLKFKISLFWKNINGNFLLVIFAGIVTSLLSLAKLITLTLYEHPIWIWSFFFGLILISAPLVLRKVKNWSFTKIIFGLFGLSFAYLITILAPAQTSSEWYMILLSGMVAICAMVLPGISGAFVLLLLGKYTFMMNALVEMDWIVILIFASGCVMGLILFSKLLAWILDHYHDATLCLLAGFMVGALNKIWPWREVIEYSVNEKGKQIPVLDQSVLPWNYLSVTGKDPQIFHAILLAAFGILLVIIIEKIAIGFKTNS